MTGAADDITLTLDNPYNGDFAIKVIQGVTPRDIIFPAGTIQGNGVTGEIVYGIANTIQLITILYIGSYMINVNEFE